MPSCTVYSYKEKEKKFSFKFVKTKDGPNNHELCAERKALKKLGTETGTFVFVLSDFPCDLCHSALQDFCANVSRCVIVSVVEAKVKSASYESMHTAIVLPKIVAASSSSSSSPATAVAEPPIASSSSALDVLPSSSYSISKKSKKTDVKKNGKAFIVEKASSSSNTNSKNLKIQFGSKTYANVGEKRLQTLIFYDMNEAPIYHIHTVAPANSFMLPRAQFAIKAKLDENTLVAAMNLAEREKEKKR